MIGWSRADGEDHTMSRLTTKDPIEQHSNRSVWDDGGEAFESAALERDRRCDVCIVGAGIAGLTIAYFMAREGRSVIVLDKASVGKGETICTSAHLSNA